MKNRLKKITITFTLIALLPVAFILFELGSVNKNERIVREIYQNQLDAILYSVNQYSDDVISSWANRINMGLSNGKAISDDSAIYSLASSGQMSAIQQLYFTNLDSQSVLFGFAGDPEDELKPVLDGLVKQHKDRIDRLVSYHEGGFRKMEPLDSTLNGNRIPIMFVLDEGAGTYKLAVLIIDLSQFIRNILGPKMQAISQDKFVIAAFNSMDKSLIYSTESIRHGSPVTSASAYQAVQHNSQKKALWLLPGYYLGISLKEVTIDDLVKDRITTTIVILSLLILTLVVGIVFLYRNIKREMDLSEAKAAFVSNVSHEIRTPLSLISMYAETLELDRVPAEKKGEYYSIIAKETERLSKIVNRILNFSQMEANKKKYEMTNVRLNDLCDEIMRSYLPHLDEKGFSVSYKKEDTLPVIRGDRDSIIEAFINLLDNAIKYSRDKKQITVVTGFDKHFVYVEVKDEGIGIRKGHHHAIFEQFFRAPSGDVHDTKGSGLGLTLVKKTMEAHRGKVTVESMAGKGSAFRLSFPMIKNEEV
ncbi:MAG TPA: HAMP domain-containing sensor histidine kinase [Ohtaekwangia sp.]|nr:HAMP domain-containing sensor histidine kinase [Ohtaekwangia sp.]